MDVTVFVPSHNEESGIRKTIESLLNQTVKPSKIVIIADNCTDNTVFISSSYTGVTVFKTENNISKKAGALNQAFENISVGEYVMIMDADTVVHRDIVKNGLEEFSLNSRLGAVCSRAGILPNTSKKILSKLLWGLQSIEYAQFDAHRVETKGNIKVAHGMATIFKTEAIKSVVSFRKETFGIDSGIFLEDSLVEDYELTLCLKHNWDISSSLSMLAWTEVPLEIGELFIQRLRWLRGGVDALRSHGFNKVTSPEILNHWLFVFLIGFRLIAVLVTLKYTLIYGLQGIHILVLAVWLLSFIDGFYRLKYVQNLSFLEVAIKISLIPEIFYNWMQAVILICAYVLSFLNIDQKW